MEEIQKRLDEIVRVSGCVDRGELSSAAEFFSEERLSEAVIMLRTEEVRDHAVAGLTLAVGVRCALRQGDFDSALKIVAKFLVAVELMDSSSRFSEDISISALNFDRMLNLYLETHPRDASLEVQLTEIAGRLRNVAFRLSPGVSEKVLSVDPRWSGMGGIEAFHRSP